MLPDSSESDSFSSKVETLLVVYRYPLLILLVGCVLIFTGILYTKGFFNKEEGKVEILEASAGTSNLSVGEIVVEINGAVQNPGVYTFQSGARIDDVIKKAGGITEEVDSSWMSKYINRAAKVSDGQKLYIMSADEQTEVLSAKDLTPGSNQDLSRTIISSSSGGGLNINAASLSELDTLPGIGPVYAQKIVDQRPYSTIDELLSKKVVSKNTFEKIKDKINVY